MLHLRQLAYVSKINPGVSRADERRIVGIAKRNNRGSGLTGILASSGSHFFQLIEGTKGAVDGLLSTIDQDARHSGVRMLFDRTITARLYAKWSMGYVFSLDLAEELAALHAGSLTLEPDTLLERFPAAELGDTVFGLPSDYGGLGTGRSV